jgi:hypothetical protein
MLDAIKIRLGTWGNKYISLGGRIVLINAVLNALPIFYLSYLRMPAKVWREVVKIQRDFFWGGLSGNRRMCWVKWDEICKPKKEGGLGVKNLQVMNLSLLAKWRWKLREGGDELWKKVVMAKYGRNVVGNINLEGVEPRVSASVWWSDICRLDRGVGWFDIATSKVVGNGGKTKLWKDVWVEGQSLDRRFPRLFGISVQKDHLISEVGSWVNGVWRWELEWRRNFFDWEEIIVQELLEVLARGNIKEEEDRWVWNPGGGDGFSVKTTYGFLDLLLHGCAPLSYLETFAFKFIWKSGAPSKVCALAWQLLLDRIPTRQNLRRRNVIRPHDAYCPFCALEVESVRHLFLHCRFTAKIWFAVLRWFGVVSVLPPSMVSSFALLVGCGSNNKRRRGLAVI